MSWQYLLKNIKKSWGSPSKISIGNHVSSMLTEAQEGKIPTKEEMAAEPRYKWDNAPEERTKYVESLVRALESYEMYVEHNAPLAENVRKRLQELGHI